MIHHLNGNYTRRYFFQRATVTAPPDPSTLIFSANPSYGVAVSTQFTLGCSGGSTLTPPLRYSIGFALTPLTAENNGATLAQNCFWVVNAGTLC